MMIGHDLSGAVRVGAKPGGLSYRADEIEIMGWAVERIGLALNLMRVRELKSAVETLEIRNEELSRLLRQA